MAENMELDDLFAKRKETLKTALDQEGETSPEKVATAELDYIQDVCEKHTDGLEGKIAAYKELVQGRELKSVDSRKKIEELQKSVIYGYKSVKEDAGKSIAAVRVKQVLSFIAGIIGGIIGFALWGNHKIIAIIVFFFSLGLLGNPFVELKEEAKAIYKAKDDLQQLDKIIEIKDDKIIFK